MNLNQLEYFVTAGELLNFTKAAKKCFISQTAMTQQISALEKTLGVPLFIRDKHHVELTTAGKVYLGEAKIILSRSDEAIRLARMASEGVAGEITIGFISGYGHSDFADILRNFRLAYPNIKVNLIKGNLSILLNLLEQNKCDLIFAISSNIQGTASINHQYITSYPVMAVLPFNHPLAGGATLSYPELKHENFIMMQPKGRSKDQMEESILIYERGGYIPNVVEIEGDHETLLLMVAAGMGISLLPEYIIRPYISENNIAIIPMVKSDGTAETVDMEISWLNNIKNPAIEQFLNVLNNN